MYTDKCMAIKNSSSDTARGICFLQTDDTVYVCNQVFASVERKVRHRVDSKISVHLKKGKSNKSNGSTLKQNVNFHTAWQSDHIQKLSILDPKAFTKSKFIAECAQGAYIAAVCRTDLKHGLTRFAQYKNPTDV